ncbi:MAG TPA: hypothetical protein PK564_03345, partial [bacterium]|nr:hypothetical protein [bacterium]
MTEQEFIAYKIPILLKEGYSKSQSAAIAFSMYRRGEHKPKAQQGKNWFDNNPNYFYKNYQPNLG